MSPIRTAFSSSTFICSNCSSGDQKPWVNSDVDKCAPHPAVEASVVRKTLGFSKVSDLDEWIPSFNHQFISALQGGDIIMRRSKLKAFSFKDWVLDISIYFMSVKHWSVWDRWKGSYQGTN